jgi:hypothetical protein
MENERSNQPAKLDPQQTVNATIVANGVMLIALQTAMRWAILEGAKMPNGDLRALVARITSEVSKAPAECFDAQDVKIGKAQVMKFVNIISDAIARELDAQA